MCMQLDESFWIFHKSRTWTAQLPCRAYQCVCELGPLWPRNIGGFLASSCAVLRQQFFVPLHFAPFRVRWTVYDKMFAVCVVLTDLLSECCSRRLVTVGPYSTMIEAIRTLCLNRVHRLPVIDPLSGNILYLLTHRRLLHYIYYFVSVVVFLNANISSTESVQLSVDSIVQDVVMLSVARSECKDFAVIDK